MAVTIGVDPHKGSHTAVAVDGNESSVAEVRVRAGVSQVAQLMSWAQRFPQRTWAVENASGLGYLLAQQLVVAGERVVDVQPKLADRVRLLASGRSDKTDANDARSVAIAALPQVTVEDHAAVMKLWAKRHKQLSAHRTKVACQLHARLCELIPGGYSGEICVSKAQQMLEQFQPVGAVATARWEMAKEILDDLR
jgi:transposase